jgi:hypothetical protein
MFGETGTDRGHASGQPPAELCVLAAPARVFVQGFRRGTGEAASAKRTGGDRHFLQAVCIGTSGISSCLSASVLFTHRTHPGRARRPVNKRSEHTASPPLGLDKLDACRVV